MRDPTFGHKLVAPDEMTWRDPIALAPGPKVSFLNGDPFGRQVLCTFRVRLPANFQVPPHRHPYDQHVIVLEGVLNLGLGEVFDRSAAHRALPGTFAVIEKGVAHFDFTGDEPVLMQVHGLAPIETIYVDPADDPRLRVSGGGAR